MPRFMLVVVAAVAAATLVSSVHATAPPVGPLPKGPVTEIRVPHGLLFSLVVPRPARAGLVWRGARQVNVAVARPLREAEVNGDIVFVYRAGHAGRTTVVYALTKGETPKAYQARYFRIVVT